MLHRIVIGCIALVGTAVAGVTDTQISFQTTDCDGSTGFASVDLQRIWRIKAADCAAPDKPDQKLQQVLVKSATGLVKYEAYTVTQEEAQYIHTQIKAFMDAKRKAVEGGTTVIIEH